MIHRDLVPGKLHIVRRIGVGGMGVVYEAIHLGLDRRVAVKVIHPQSSESSEARTRFIREARALALLQSEHIVQVLDVDTLPDGDPYMVMEYLEGRDLKRELTKRGPLPVAEAVGYLIQASTGVAAAHGAGIIHRDIKPANIFITRLDGARRAKILDFGVAKFSASSDQSLTGPTSRLGTPLYMSPEQIAGLEADARCDVWALGVVLFQLLTGHSPFRPKGNEGTLGAILGGTPTLLHEVREDVPLSLSRVVARCFERMNSERFGDALEFAAALAPFGPRELTVRASQRAPRGSSAPPPAALLDAELPQQVSAAISAELVSIRELITVTHADRAKLAIAPPLAGANVAAGGASAASGGETEQERDPHGTVRFAASQVASTRAATPPVTSSVVLQSEDSGSNGRKRWKKFAMPLGGMLLLGVVVALRWPLVVPIARAPAAEPRATPSAVALSREGDVATLTEQVAPLAASARPAPDPPLSAAPHSGPRVTPSSPGGSARPNQPGTTVRTQSMSKPMPQASPASPAGSAAVPLHL